MLLDDDGLVELSAPLADVLAGINTTAPYDTPITLAQLLSHTAGYLTFLRDDTCTVDLLSTSVGVAKRQPM